MDTIRIRAKISGRVQGVFFRISARNEAERLGMSGFVRNESDGTVMIEAEGKSESVEALLAWAAHGPPLARVDRIEKDEVPICRERGFRIMR